MATNENRGLATCGKRSHPDGPEDELETTPTKKMSNTPMKLAEAEAQDAQEDLGDMGALLLVAFANHVSSSSTAPSSPHKPDSCEAVVAPAPMSPLISEEASRSDSSSETAGVGNSNTNDSSSDGEDYEESADCDSDYGQSGFPTKNRDDENVLSQRRRVGQHFNKRRHRTSAEQLRVLEMTYAGNKVPNQELRKDLANQLGMTTRRVQIWFQNKRAKEKRLKTQAQAKPQATAFSIQPSHSQHSTITAPAHLPSSAISPVSSPIQNSFPSTGSSAVPSLTFPRSFNSQHTPPPSLSAFMDSPLSAHGMASPISNGMPIAWLPQGNSAIYYPHMMSVPQMSVQSPSHLGQQMAFPSMWTIAPLR